MRVLISQVEMSGAQCWVHFQGDCGRGIAVWEGVPPNPGDSRFIELSVESAVTAANFVETAEPPGVGFVGRKTALTGHLVASSDGPFFRFEFGCGSLELEIEGTAPTSQQLCRLEVTVVAFDCDY